MNYTEMQQKLTAAANLLLAAEREPFADVFFEVKTAVWFLEEDGAGAPILPSQLREVLTKQVSALTDDELLQVAHRAAGWVMNDRRRAAT